MKKYLLFSAFAIITVVLIGAVVYTFYASNQQAAPQTARETVVVFCDLLKKEDKKAMENYVTDFPAVYWQQIYEQTRKSNNFEPDGSEPDSSQANPNILKEAPSSRKDDIPPATEKSKSKLLEKVNPSYLFEQKRYLKSITRVLEKDNQARVEVVLGSPLVGEGFGDLPTNFWLYKEKDGQWRIFLIQSTVMNESYAQ